MIKVEPVNKCRIGSTTNKQNLVFIVFLLPYKFKGIFSLMDIRDIPCVNYYYRSDIYTHVHITFCLNLLKLKRYILCSACTLGEEKKLQTLVKFFIAPNNCVLKH